MKTVALIAQKGGVGKTTLAVNIAVTAERAGIRTALFDLDLQESAMTWAERRAAEAPHVEFLTERRLPDGIAAAAKGGFGLTVIDTPPSAGPQALTAAQNADLILVPCRLSLVDLDAIRRTAQLVKSAQRPAYIVFNAASATATTLIDDARAIAEAAGLEAAPTVVRERSAFRSGWPLGKGAVEVEPDGKGAAEIAELTIWLCSILNMCTPDIMHKIRRAARS